ncbi:VOC family protein [Chitinophaga pendula]|uniref:VOC family protein n=1 Tax=Chitinophaga TaxID=79328 RepID=UPI000BB0C4C8|nr:MULTISPECIES: VOC family protein [Chitinophaga]ASZ11907.1 glyoxalase [Chitinophaga sp. MD30]UCJ05065.1 VOC family protein [Chitinophaga pendula]
MAKMIFVNLPVKDLQQSKDFFTQLGYSFNPQFTDDKAACLVISDTIFAMLLTEEYFKSFSNQEVADTSKVNEVILALSADSKEQLIELVDKAVAAGATEPKPATDYGFMYSRTFNDLDGHRWEIVYMDPNAVQQ